MRRFLALLSGILIALSGATVADAATPPTETIRVGCVDIGNFLEIGDDGYAYGYAAEYLAEIARYTGWNYEYVEGTWNECISWLEEGTIDLLLPAEYSEARAEKFLFSSTPCCTDYTSLVCMEENRALCYNDPQTYEGIRVGMIRENQLNAGFEDYVAKNDLTVERTYVETTTELCRMLEDGTVDAIVYGNLGTHNEFKTLVRISYTPTYFITSRAQPERMEQLNEALNEILLDDLYYEAALYEKYYDTALRQAVGFTSAEQEYISKAGPITVLYEKNSYPLEWYNEKTGEYEGLFPELMELIAQKSGLTFVPVAPGQDPAKSTWDRVAQGDANILVSAYRAAQLTGIYDTLFTEPYYTCSVSLIARRGESFSMEEALPVAMLSGQEGVRAYIKNIYPNWKIIEYPSIEQCIMSVCSGETKGALVNAVVLQTQTYQKHKEQLVTLLQSVAEIPVSLGIGENQPQILISILNKAIRMLDKEDLLRCELDMVIGTQHEQSIVELIQDNPLLTIAIISIIIILTIFTLYQSRMNQTMRRSNHLLEEKNRELQEAREQEQHLRHEAETDSLTGLLNKGAVEACCQNYLQLHPQGPAAAFMLDVDDFKSINDRFGHQGGDEFLHRFADLIRGVCREEDIVGRIGGDEFIILFRNTSSQELLVERASTLLRQVSTAFGQYAGTTCSIGIALFPQAGEDYDSLFAAADAALYRAKNAGKNQYSF